MKKEQTIINWISVTESLPKDKKTVLILLDSSPDVPVTGIFYPETGWRVTNHRECAAPIIKFWSEYNLPR